MSLMTLLPEGLEGRLRARASLERTRRLLLDPERPTWDDARLIVFDTDLTVADARAWLPPGLAPTDPPRATVFVADYPDTSFGVAYRECGVLVHARFRRGSVLHCAWMVVDDDTAMILGRELLGFPKKLAQIDFAVGDGMLHARVRRRGTELLRIDGRVREALAPTKAFPHPIVNVRGLPSLAPALLWQMEVPERFREGRTADLEIRFGNSDHDPLAPLQPGGGKRAGAWVRADLGVPPPQPGVVPRGILPVGVVSPLWLAKQYPFRTF